MCGPDKSSSCGVTQRRPEAGHACSHPLGWLRKHNQPWDARLAGRGETAALPLLREAERRVHRGPHRWPRTWPLSSRSPPSRSQTTPCCASGPRTEPEATGPARGSSVWTRKPRLHVTPWPEWPFRNASLIASRYCLKLGNTVSVLWVKTKLPERPRRLSTGLGSTPTAATRGLRPRPAPNLL